MDFRLPQPGSASWLKAVKEALKTPGSSVTPPKNPEAYEHQWKGENLARVRLARALIESAAMQVPIAEVKKLQCVVRVVSEEVQP